MDGEKLRLEVSDDFVIVTDADGNFPGIKFFDHDLNDVKFIELENQLEAPYNIAVYYTPEYETTQVLIAGTNKISIIEHVPSKRGDDEFNVQKDIFISLESQPFENDQTFMAKSGDYLVVKQSSLRNLGLMPICPYKYIYDEDTFSCNPCEPGLRSYGL